MEITPVAPTITFSYQLKEQQFLIKGMNVSEIAYELVYEKSQETPGTTKEALTGAQKADAKGIVTLFVKAGTQSGKDFIPHTVKSGSLAVKGTDQGGRPFTYTETFVVTAQGDHKTLSSELKVDSSVLGAQNTTLPPSTLTPRIASSAAEAMPLSAPLKTKTELLEDNQAQTANGFAAITNAVWFWPLVGAAIGVGIIAAVIASRMRR